MSKVCWTELVGGDAHIAPPSIERLPYVARADVGIGPYKFRRNIPIYNRYSSHFI